MYLPDKIYDIMKWIVILLLPALGTLYFALSQIWDLPMGEEVVGSLSAITVFLGSILSISTHEYTKRSKEEE